MDPPPSDQPPLHAVAAGAYLAAIPTAPAPPTANANPILAQIPNHPPYNEMITAAITALKEKEGSSKQAISKYIEAAYPNLPAAHPALLTHHLKRLKNSGQLVMVKKSYMLPPAPGSGSDPAPAMAAPAADFFGSPGLKKRGRPPKPKPVSAEPQPGGISIGDPSAGLGNGGVVPAKKRPGRPPKLKPASGAAYHQDQHQQQPVYAAEPISSSNPAVVGSGLVNGSASLPKRRGRPPKDRVGSVGEQALGSWTEVSGGGSGLVKRGRGRPPKGGRPRGRPRKSGGLVAAVSQAPAGGARRGRPRKLPAVAVDVGGIPAVGMKRRGRPPKSVAGPGKPRIGRTGRPVGRPRKNAPTMSTQAYGQSEGTATEELTRKLEYMQLKVKNAVGLLKPHLINANIIDILTAIQDLEELAAMDITVPPMTVVPTAPMADTSAPPTADMSAPPTDTSVPVVDLTAPAYVADPGAAGQLPVTFN